MVHVWGFSCSLYISFRIQFSCVQFGDIWKSFDIFGWDMFGFGVAIFTAVAKKLTVHQITKAGSFWSHSLAGATFALLLILWLLLAIGGALLWWNQWRVPKTSWTSGIPDIKPSRGTTGYSYRRTLEHGGLYRMLNQERARSAVVCTAIGPCNWKWSSKMKWKCNIP